MGKQTKQSKAKLSKKPTKAAKGKTKQTKNVDPKKDNPKSNGEDVAHVAKSTKAITKKSPQASPSKGKRRGLKSCQGCEEKIPIHLRVCTYCGTVNSMKKTVHTLANIINSATPKGLQALLESNQTNSLLPPTLVDPSVDLQSEGSYEVVSQDSKKPHQFKIFTEDQEIVASGYQIIEVTDSLSVFSAGSQLRCVRIRQTSGLMAFVEQAVMEAEGMREADMLTLKAHNLENLLQVNQRYNGTAYIYVMREPFANCQVRLLIPHFIVQIEWVSDSHLAVLTGQGYVEIYKIPSNLSVIGNRMATYSQKVSINKEESFTGPVQQNICIMEVLTSCPQPTLVCGDWRGNICMYEINLNTHRQTLKRCFMGAHYGYITAIRNCPINSAEEVLFVSGGYDGYVKIWSTKQLNAVYLEEVSNRKIMDLQWDSGAKFIIVLVDDQNEGCILVSLYSSVKVDGHLRLMQCSQLRYIKELTHYNVPTTTTQILTTNPYLQQAAFASGSGTITFCPLEELRKLSVKRKKCKASEAIGGTIAVKFDERGVHIQRDSVPQLLNESLDLSAPIITGLDFLRRPQQTLLAATTSRGLLLIYRPTL